MYAVVLRYPLCFADLKVDVHRKDSSGDLDGVTGDSTGSPPVSARSTGRPRSF